MPQRLPPAIQKNWLTCKMSRNMSDAETFQLSIPAQNIEARFFNKIGIVYVEGPDDVIFWSQYFNKSLFEIRPLDGCKNLVDYENDIINHGLKCIVAKDADYSSYISSVHKHPLIVCTLSHSIECVMYCPYNINTYLQRLTRSLCDYTAQIVSCYKTFYEDITELLVYDIANNVFGVGCSVCGDSCLPFMKSNSSIQISKDKIESFLKKISSHFTSQQLSEARKHLEADSRHKRQICKGHFQTNFIINLLKYLTRISTGHNPSISKDAIYAQLVKCNTECHCENCNERTHIENMVASAIVELKHY